MSIVEISATVDAPPDRVWAVVADPRNLPKWDRHIVAVDGVPSEGLEKGTTYTTETRFMGARARATAEVLELKPPEYSKVRLRGVVDATVETWLEPVDGGRTRLRHRIDYRFRGGPLGELAARAFQALGATAMLRRGVEAQKRQAEQA